MTCNNRIRLFFVNFTILNFFILIVLINNINGENLQFKNTDRTLDSCEKCKILVDSFKAGLKRTQRGKHDGGDTDWEENKLNNYANSEIRLVEIQENLCQEATSGKDQCHSLAESYESDLEEWFFNYRKQERQEQKEEGSTLFEYFCNGITKACCPDGHFGPDCVACIGYPDNICYNRGYCDGNGTRTGKGKCVCFSGYTGKSCEMCAKNHFQLGTVEKVDNNKQNIELPAECVRCDISCSSSCHSIGPKGCHVCKEGYFWDNENGCTDIDECLSAQTNPCLNDTYCVNSLGSYQCYQCDLSCKRCTGPGPSCIECNEDFTKVWGQCVRKGQSWLVTLSGYTNYLIYLCLFVIALIIGRINLLIASIVCLFTGAFFAIYELGIDYLLFI